MRKVLITGATGFVGQHLTDLLSSSGNYEIFGTSLSDQVSNDKIAIEKIDLADYESVLSLVKKIEPDLIFHLAALTSPAESFNNPTPVVLGNIGIQMNLLNAIKSTKLNSRVMVISSGEIYGLVDEKDLPINEKTSLRPGNPYAVSKIAQDFLGLQYHLTYKMDIVRVRPFNHTGPGQSPSFVIPAFAKQIAQIEKEQKEPVISVGSLDAKRDFTDVRDIVKGYMLLSEEGISGEVYNIGSGKSYSIKNMLDKLLSLSNKKITIKEDPEKIRPVETPNIYCDYSKLKSLTGWVPEIPIEKTLQDTLDYWRSIV